MISYRDRTHCDQDTCSNATTCGRYLTEEIKRDAINCGLPLSISMFTHCYSPLTVKAPIKQGAPNAIAYR